MSPPLPGGYIAPAQLVPRRDWQFVSLPSQSITITAFAPTINDGETFSNAPFTMEDSFLDYTGSAHFNLQFIFQGSSNQLESQEGVFPGSQYTTFRPGQNPGPDIFYTQWFENESGDAPDSFFPAMGTLVSVNGNNSIGFSRPGVGNTKDGTFIVRGIDDDMVTVLALRRYRIRYIRS